MNWKFWETDASAESGVSVAESTATKSSARIQMALLVEMVRMLRKKSSTTWRIRRITRTLYRLLRKF